MLASYQPSSYYPSFLMPQVIAQEQEFKTNKRKLDKREGELDHREETLTAREQELQKREEELAKRQRQLDDRESGLCMLRIDDRLACLARQEELHHLEQKVDAKSSKTAEQCASLKRQQVELNQKSEKLEKKKSGLKHQIARLRAAEKLNEQKTKELQTLEVFRATLEKQVEAVNLAKKGIMEIAVKSIAQLKAFEMSGEEFLEHCKKWNPTEVIPEDPISYERLENPIVDEFGHSYELQSLLEHLERQNTSPLTKKKYTHPDLLPRNLALIEVIDKLQMEAKKHEERIAFLQGEMKKVTNLAKEFANSMAPAQSFLTLTLPIIPQETHEKLSHMPAL